MRNIDIECANRAGWRRRSTAILCLAVLAGIAQGGWCTTDAATSFRIVGSNIVDPDGNVVTIKGVNISGLNGSFPREVTQDADLISKIWKFNTVRVNCNVRTWQGASPVNNDIDRIITAFTSRKVIVMFEAHDRTGRYFTDDSTPSLGDLAAWFSGLATKYRDNPYVWFNVQNEPPPLSPQWLTIHQRVIAAIRATGNESPIVCDGAFWGQDVNQSTFDPANSAFLTDGPQIFSFGGKTYDNIIFSFHIYTMWCFDPSGLTMGRFEDAVQQSGECLIAGEWAQYSWNPNGPETDVKDGVISLFNSAVPRGIGRIYWSWFGSDNPLCLKKPGTDPSTGWPNSGGGWQIDRTDGSMPTNLTWAGTQAWVDNHHTPDGPDLTIDALTWSPEHPKPGDAVTFYATVKNQGDRPTPAGSSVGAAVWIDGVKANWTYGQAGALAPGGQATVEMDQAQWIAASGPHAIEARADFANRIPEGDPTNKYNNRIVMRLEVGQ